MDYVIPKDLDVIIGWSLVSLGWEYFDDGWKGLTPNSVSNNQDFASILLLWIIPSLQKKIC